MCSTSSLLRLCILSISLLLGADLQAGRFPQPITEGEVKRAPHKFMGRIRVKYPEGNFVGSGTLIKPASVLTAAHLVWDRKEGWATQAWFHRAIHGSSPALSVTRSSWVKILGGYQQQAQQYGPSSPLAFERDMAAILLPSAPAQGQHAPWLANSGLLIDNSAKMSMGYGAYYHSGLQQLRAVPTTPYYQSNGGYYLNDSIATESGMSGGPVWAFSNGQYHEVAVVVSGDYFGTSSGVRAIDTKAFNFINRHLY